MGVWLIAAGVIVFFTIATTLRAPVAMKDAAFGALHLSGSQGVLQLLENEGFTLERLPF